MLIGKVVKGKGEVTAPNMASGASCLFPKHNGSRSEERMQDQKAEKESFRGGKLSSADSDGRWLDREQSKMYIHREGPSLNYLMLLNYSSANTRKNQSS